jgi:hypothetical protein
MESIIIPATNKTPNIELCQRKGLIYIDGRSITETPQDYFTHINDWFKSYINNLQPITTIELDFTYINTITSKLLFRFLKDITNNLEPDKYRIKWYYEEDDESIMEMGNDYSNVLGVPFIMQMKLDEVV